MAHFAKVDGGLVTQVIVAEDLSWCEQNLGGRWIQTSYNTHAGKHLSGGNPLRKNYAGIGYTYDEHLDAFIPPICHGEAVLHPDTCTWICHDPRHEEIDETPTL